MGLFRRKTDDPQQREALRTEIEEFRKRLDAADEQKERLRAELHVVAEYNTTIDEKVRAIDAAHASLNGRVGSIDEARVALDDRVETIRSASAELSERVGLVGSLSSTVQQISDRLTTMPPPESPPTLLDPRVDELAQRVKEIEAGGSDADDELLRDLTTRLDQLALTMLDQQEQLAAAREKLATVDEVSAEMTRMAARMSGLDDRMRSISLELTSQLTELSNDLEVLLEDADVDTGPKIDPHQLQLTLTTQVDERVDEALDEIHKSTERLAAEQARYEIKFREDLAELAERLRRPAMMR